MSLPRLAVSRPVTMFMVSIVVVLLGVVSLLRLPVDLMPEINFPALSISVTYDGVGPLEVEELVTRPIEQAVGAISGLDQISSTSSEGQSAVQLSFLWGTDLTEAVEDVRARLDLISDRLPEDASAPTIFKFDVDALPIIFLGVEGDLDPVTLRETAENEIAPRLERVPGVAAVTVSGGQRREIRVALERDKIEALGIAPDAVISVLRAANQNIPVGEIDEGDITYLVRSQGQFTSLADIQDLVVTTRNSVPVQIRDVANVQDTTEDLRSIVRINGQPGLQMLVTKQSGQNTIAVAGSVRDELERVNREVTGVEVSVLVDTSEFIERSVASVRQMVLVGAVLVVAVIFTFLRNLRSTLVICSSIPISIIGTFALLYFGGYTLNTLTFGGLALGVGMIVDSAIVVLENTYRHMEKGEARVTAAVKGTEEVWSAIVASSLTQVAVFVPLLFLTGIASIMFGSLAIVVIFSLSMSLFVAVTLVPVLCSRLLHLPEPDDHPGAIGRFVSTSGRLLDALDEAYRRLLHRALAHRVVVVSSAVALFVASLALLPLVGFELTPAADEGQVEVTAELPVGTRIERAEAALRQIEQLILQSVPEAETVIAQTGSVRAFGPGGGVSDELTFSVTLVPRSRRARSSEDVARALRRELVGVPGVIARTRASGDQFNVNRALGGGQSQFSVEVRGHDLADQARLSSEIQVLMASTPGVTDVSLESERGRPEMGVVTDVRRAALWGLSVTDVANTLRTSVGGTEAALYRERGEEYPIVVRMDERDRHSLSDVGEMVVSAGEGRVLRVKDLIEVRPRTGPVEVRRRDQERVSRVTAEVETVLNEAIRRVDTQLSAIEVPSDFSVGFGAEVEEQNEAFLQLILVLILAIVLVYAVMASQFESLKDPFIIMFSIPLAAIGVVGALLITGTPFSLPAGIGVVLLAGLVVNNAILLVDYTNTLRRRDGLPLFEAIELAGRTRLRPILMTSLTTMLGLTPMALGIGDGAEMQAPMARVVIGGLATSTLITLVVVPTVYSLFEGGAHRRGLKDKGQGPPDLQAAGPVDRGW